jgi:hypothetical protein
MRSLFGDMGMRSLLGMWGAIAKRCCKQFAFGVWGCDSEALLQAVRFLGCGDAIAKRCCKQFAFWDVGVRSLF